MKIRSEEVSAFVQSLGASIKDAVEKMRNAGIDCDPPDTLDIELTVIHAGGLDRFDNDVTSTPGTEVSISESESDASTQTGNQSESRSNSGGTESQTLYFYESDS